MKETYTHSSPDQIVRINSYLTGNVITINLEPYKFYISPENWAVVYDVIQTAQQLYNGATRWDCRWSPACEEMLCRLGDAKDFRELCSMVDDIFHDKENRWFITETGEVRKKGTSFVQAGFRVFDKQFVRSVFLDLWKRKAILFPLAFPFGRRKNLSEWLDGNDKNLFREIDSLKLTTTYTAWLKGHVLSCWGIKSICDFLPDVLAPSLQKPRKDDLSAGIKSQFSLVGDGKAIISYQQAHTEIAITHTAEQYRAILKSSRDDQGLRDLDLHTITDQDPNMAEWRQLALAYYATGVVNKRVIHQAIKAFLQYFLENPHLSKDPSAYLDKRKSCTPFHIASEARRNNALVTFIDWVIASKYTLPDENSGNPITLPWVGNPFKSQKRDRNKQPETTRESMPILLVEKALEILTANDWAWAKSQFGAGKTADGDWYKKYDPLKKEWTIVWSPVRAVALFTRLTTVFRTFQIRHLDSGEMDNVRVKLADRENHIYQVVNNTHALAGKNRKKPVAKGVVQTYVDEKTGQILSFLRVSTNKTADKQKDAWEKGYDCPWAPIEVIERFLWLREWQEQNNPAERAVDWKNVPELNSIHPNEALHGMSGTFLFRDPASAHTNHPITHGKIQTLWYLLNDEVEKRIAKEGLISDVGEKLFTLITSRSADGYPTAAYYDMHSLRVTRITALYKRGLPVKVIMLIAGHATVPMSLYYTKLSMTEIKECISRADQSVNDIDKQKEWVTSIKERQLVDVKPLLAYNDEEALTTFAGTDQDLVFMDCGICTAGCSKCNIGTKIHTTKKEVAFLPVPGGRKNCASCRFLVSGPPFLLGLNATVNVKSLTAQQISIRRSQAEKVKAKLEIERREAQERGVHFLKFNELKKAAEQFDILTKEIDQVFDEMGAASTLLIQCISIHNSQLEKGLDKEAKLALVTQDMNTIKQQFEESNEFDLIDRVCQDSMFYETTRGNTVDAANLKRIRYYDRMLERHGLPPAFLVLDDQTALEAGNALSRLLKTRIGRKGTLELMDGLKKLQEFNILPQTICKAIEDTAGRPLFIERGSKPMMLEGGE